MKLTVSKSKNSASFYVQKTIRKENGSVTTVTVEKLGNLDEVRTKACGKDPYVWAQEYVNELNRKEYDEQKAIIVSYSPTKLLRKGEQKASNCGYLFLQDIYYSLGLHKICSTISSRSLFGYDLNDILSKLIFIVKNAENADNNSILRIWTVKDGIVIIKIINVNLKQFYEFPLQGL